MNQHNLYCFSVYCTLGPECVFFLHLRRQGQILNKLPPFKLFILKTRFRISLHALIKALTFSRRTAQITGEQKHHRKPITVQSLLFLRPLHQGVSQRELSLSYNCFINTHTWGLLFPNLVGGLNLTVHLMFSRKHSPLLRECMSSKLWT